MRTAIRNNTPDILLIRGAEDRLRLAPLEEKHLTDVDGFDLGAATADGLVSQWTIPDANVAEKLIPAAFAIAAGGGGIVAGISDSVSKHPTLVWGIAAIIYVGILGALAIRWMGSWGRVARFLVQMVTLLVVVAIGIGLPSATVYFFGGDEDAFAAASPQFFARLLQVAFIAVASLLPVLLYFLFDRFQLNTIRQRIYADLFRADRTLKMRADIDARFGLQIQELYGPEDRSRGRIAPGTRWPVLVCAFVTTMGWLALFRPVGGVSPAVVVNPLSFAPSAWAFGFLGTYFFGLQLIALRYARGDLKPKAYAYITIRILTVTVLSWVLDAMFGGTSGAKLTAAFLIGIVPDEFFTFVREKLRPAPAVTALVPEPERDPLTRLQGIDLYDRARLEQEGITNIESLAHADFLRLVFDTSIPVARLVDWLDQAILYLHVTEQAGDDRRVTLRHYGIRTATDLLTCWDAAEARGELDSFKNLLGGGATPYPLEIIRDALLDDEWLGRVQDWRKDTAPVEQLVDATPRSFEGWSQWGVRLVDSHRYRQAISTLRHALDFGDSAQVRVRLAALLAAAPDADLRNAEEAREQAQVAFTLDDSDVYVLSKLIFVYNSLGDYRKELELCEHTIAQFKSSSSEVEKALVKIADTRRSELVQRLQAAGV